MSSSKSCTHLDGEENALTSFGPAQIVATAGEHPQPERWLEISRVILPFANGIS
jgi:hypothetical protein